MSSTTSEIHRFFSACAAEAFIATLRVARKSYRVARYARPKPGRPLYAVVVYG
jgi:hypothetical protein